MNNVSGGRIPQISISVALLCLVAIAFAMQGSGDPGAAGTPLSSNLRLCYESVATSATRLNQPVTVSGRSGSGRRCGELAQFRAFGSGGSHPVIAEARPNASVDCFAGRKHLSEARLYQSAFSRGGCEDAVGANALRQVERFWF